MVQSEENPFMQMVQSEDSMSSFDMYELSL